MTDALSISEVFGPTVQGEGATSGRRCAFVRLGLCNLDCSFCVAPDTRVLMADWTERPISEVVVGDLVMSYRNRRYEIARVEQTMTRDADRVTVVFGDREVICTADHIFATPHQVDGRRRCPAGELTGRHVRTTRLNGWGPDEDIRTDEWWTGWLQGTVLGDGHVGQSEVSPYPKVWLRVCDREFAEAFSLEVNRRGAATTVREQRRRTVTGKIVYSVAFLLSKVPEVVGLPSTPDEIAGFLAGFFDAEGHAGTTQITISQKDDKTLERVAGMLESLDIPSTLKPCSDERVGTVTVNGTANVDRFFRLTRPVLTRKSHNHRKVDSMLTAVEVETVKEATPGPVVNLTTSTGFFFANGALVEQCDTPFTWDWTGKNGPPQDRKALVRMTPEEIVMHLATIDVDRVVISGGEPMVQRGRLGPLVSLLKANDYTVEVETNGTLVPTPELLAGVDHWNVSPKLPHSGVEFARAWRADALSTLLDTGRAVLKVVCCTVDDVTLVGHHLERAGIDWPAGRIWIMPEGITPEAIEHHGRAITQRAIDLGYNVSTRLHVLTWGNLRGV